MPDFRSHDGPGADNGHVTLQDVPELRQLIQTRFSQKRPQAAYPRVLGQLLRQIPLLPGRRISLQQIMKRAISILDHRPELVTPEQAPAAPHPQLRINNRAAVKYKNKHRNRQKKRRKECNGKQGHQPVKNQLAGSAQP